MADSIPRATSNGTETPKMDISSLYAPNQPYFPGVIERGFANQTLVAVGVDPLRLVPLRPPFPNPPEHLACPDFFNHFDKDIFEHQDFDGVYWQYIMRREAQAIFPFLWIGPAAVARNADYLKENGITLLLGIRTTHPSHALIVNGTRAAETLGIQCEHVAVDGINELVGLMPSIIRGINEHVCRCPRHAPVQTSKLNKALVFCETGNEKSLAVIVGYLMAMVGLDLATAAHNVQARRLCANFDVNQRDMLASFEGILNAQRDVARAHAAQSLAPVSSGSTQQARRKRSFVDAGMGVDNANGDETAGLENDEVRQQPPPFCDRNP